MNHVYLPELYLIIIGAFKATFESLSNSHLFNFVLIIVLAAHKEHTSAYLLKTVNTLVVHTFLVK